MKNTPLAKVCDISMGQAPAGASYNDAGRGLPLIAGAGDFSDGKIRVKKYTIAPTRVSKPGDIILGIRATIGVKAWADDVYCLGRGVAGLRPKPGVDPSYLWHWLSHARSELEGRGRGATFLQVNRADISDLEVPLPPMDEQRRIAAVLDQADELRAKRKTSLALIGSLTEAIFLELVSEPVWPSSPIEALAADQKHAIRTGPFGSQLLHSEFVEEGVAVLGIDNAVQDRFVWARPRYITAEKFEQLQRYQVRPGDVIVTIMGTCGRCAVVPDDIPVAINTKHLCCISLDIEKCLPEFLWACLKYDQAVRRQLGATARGAVMPGLNMGLIKSAEVPLPPMEVQHDFIRRLRRVREVDERLAQSDREFDSLFSSLQQRAFAGHL